MRVVAGIYLAIVLVNFLMWFVHRGEQAVFPTSYSYLVWALFCFSVLALLAYVLGRRLLPRRVWQVVLVVYVATRMAEWFLAGQVLTGESLTANLNILATYLWMVVPAGLAMAYLGFAPRGDCGHVAPARSARWTVQG